MSAFWTLYWTALGVGGALTLASMFIMWMARDVDREINRLMRENFVLFDAWLKGGESDDEKFRDNDVLLGVLFAESTANSLVAKRLGRAGLYITLPITTLGLVQLGWVLAR